MFLWRTYFLFAAVAVVIVLAIAFVLHSSSISADEGCTRRVSTASPALDAVEYYDTEFANSFGERSPYRGPPTVERERLWFELWAANDVLVTPEQFQQLNRANNGKDYVKARPEYGNGYVALLEAFHQIHCLDVIRMYTWWVLGKYPEDRIPPPMTGGPKANRIHVDHCIESLRLTLMCQGDVTPVLKYKMPSAALGKKPEFSSHHKCRNFTRIKEWVAENKVIEENTPGNMSEAVSVYPGHPGYHDDR
ncbi:protein of unknown function (DUF3328) domain containing protein [Rhypophila sp. PSN 637]